MEGLVVMLALLLGTALAVGVSMAGLHLIISFVPSPGGADGSPQQDAPARDARPSSTA